MWGAPSTVNDPTVTAFTPFDFFSTAKKIEDNACAVCPAFSISNKTDMSIFWRLDTEEVGAGKLNEPIVALVAVKVAL